MFNAELTAAKLAALVEVDVKSVQRWLTEDRIPYPVTRGRVAHALHQGEAFLWPALLESSDSFAVSASELDQIWPTRSGISSETWHALFSKATSELDVLVYAGAFLIETLDLADVLRWKASTGARIRILVGSPDAPAVRVRAAELHLDWLPERCRSTLRYLRQVANVPGVTVRPHGTTHYASLFRFDNTLLANTHVFGAWACHSPVHQLSRSSSGGLFDFYAHSFEQAWMAASATPASDNCSDTAKAQPGSLPIDLE